MMPTLRPVLLRPICCGSMTIKSSSSRPVAEKTDLPELVSLRLDWEVYSEFTLRAGIGRTLEVTGFASAGIDMQRFNPAIAALHQQLGEEFGDLMSGVSAEQVAHLALGVLWRMRQAGAVMHPAFGEGYRRDGKTFMMTQKERTSRYAMPSVRAENSQTCVCQL